MAPSTRDEEQSKEGGIVEQSEGEVRWRRVREAFERAGQTGQGAQNILPLLLTVIFKLHTRVFLGGCAPQIPPLGQTGGGRAEVLGGAFWVALLVFGIFCCGFQAPGGIPFFQSLNFK